MEFEQQMPYGVLDYPQAQFAAITVAGAQQVGVAPPQIAFGDGDAVGQAHPYN